MPGSVAQSRVVRKGATAHLDQHRSLDEAPGGEGRLGHYRVSVESCWDRHRGGRRGDQREPQIPLVGVIISILSGGLVLALGRQGRVCWRRPAGWAPGRAPTVSWLVHSPGSGREPCVADGHVFILPSPRISRQTGFRIAFVTLIDDYVLNVVFPEATPQNRLAMAPVSPGGGVFVDQEGCALGSASLSRRR